jgi:uncharacterized protein YecT (DUF1311 family)
MIYRYTLSLLIVSLSLSAQPLEQKSCFKKAQSTDAILTCINRHLKQEDARLNQNYREAMKRIAPFRRESLQKVQRLWIGYAHAKCDFFYHKESGSGGLVDAQSCLLEETTRRADELGALY